LLRIFGTLQLLLCNSNN